MNWIELNVREQSLDFSCSVIGVDMRGISVTFWPFVFLSACFRSPWLHISVFWRKLQYVQENHRSVVKACNAFHNYTVKVFVCFLLVCLYFLLSALKSNCFQCLVAFSTVTFWLLKDMHQTFLKKSYFPSFILC